MYSMRKKSKSDDDDDDDDDDDGDDDELFCGIFQPEPLSEILTIITHVSL